MPSSEVIASVHFSRKFMQELKAPENTTKLAFVIEAGGLLTCVATHEVRGPLGLELAVKEWQVRLSRTSVFYQLITGES
jgi:hypothetical protein